MKKWSLWAKRYDVLVVHDLAYADIVYDGWKAPSIMQVPGARDVAVEFFYTVEKTIIWRAGVLGLWWAIKPWSARWRALKVITIMAPLPRFRWRLSPLWKAISSACADIAEQYKRRRDVLVKGLHEAGWMVEMPKASMYVWAKIPEQYAAMGSLEFAKKLLNEAKVCVSPGIGFGDYGDTPCTLCINRESRPHSPGRQRD